MARFGQWLKHGDFVVQRVDFGKARHERRAERGAVMSVLFAAALHK